MGTLLPGLLRTKSKGLALVVLLLLTKSLASQRILNFNLSSSGGIVRIDFSVAKGSTCDGYRIYHSLDSLFFTVIEDYAGICSSTTENVPHSYNHTNPSPKAINYYKIELAFVETSPIQSIYVDDQSRPLLTPYPNPVPISDGLVKLRTSNTENGMLEGFICDEIGHKFQEVLVNSYDYKLELPLNGLSTGIYFIWLSDGVYAYGAKLIISP
jgi:hypothetical protein